MDSTFGISFPGGAVLKNPPAKAGDTRDAGSVPGLRRSPGEGNGDPLQCSCLGNPMDRGAWRATVHRVQRVGHDWAHICTLLVSSLRNLCLPWSLRISSCFSSLCFIVLYFAYKSQSDRSSMKKTWNKIITSLTPKPVIFSPPYFIIQGFQWVFFRNWHLLLSF